MTIPRIGLTVLSLASIGSMLAFGPFRRASAQLEARAELVLPLLVRTIAGNPLFAVLKLLDDADLLCARLVCRAFRGHSSPALKKCRRMTGFVVSDYALEWMSTLSLAVSVGCVGVLEELVDNRQCVLTTWACRAAAGKGNLHALMWLRSRGCSWDINTIYSAAKGGHLEVLRYTHEHGCPWDSVTC
ncbi:hypothetical protein T492DRAFT_918928 [Pavlovales sp. CCMP2436]|nr:hypothetical protein T492DRAFT_918928 [Pavlovales sp. CCMP2436]